MDGEGDARWRKVDSISVLGLRMDCASRNAWVRLSCGEIELDCDIMEPAFSDCGDVVVKEETFDMNVSLLSRSVEAECWLGEGVTVRESMLPGVGLRKKRSAIGRVNIGSAGTGGIIAGGKSASRA